jgi:hypothetical protein
MSVGLLRRQGLICRSAQTATSRRTLAAVTHEFGIMQMDFASGSIASDIFFFVFGVPGLVSGMQRFS